MLSLIFLSLNDDFQWLFLILNTYKSCIHTQIISFKNMRLHALFWGFTHHYFMLISIINRIPISINRTIYHYILSFSPRISSLLRLHASLFHVDLHYQQDCYQHQQNYIPLYSIIFSKDYSLFRCTCVNLLSFPDCSFKLTYILCLSFPCNKHHLILFLFKVHPYIFPSSSSSRNKLLYWVHSLTQPFLFQTSLDSYSFLYYFPWHSAPFCGGFSLNPSHEYQYINSHVFSSSLNFSCSLVSYTLLTLKRFTYIFFWELYPHL